MMPRHFLTLLLASATFLYGRAPSDTTTVCDRLRQNDVIFTGTAEATWINMVETRTSPPIRKRSLKSKQVRFLVREWFKGTRKNLVEVWMTPGDCAMKIESGETYLLYLRLNKDTGRLETNACQGTKPVADAASDLSYLTAAQSGAERATRVSGGLGSGGLNVQAKSGIDIRYAVTDGAGRFTFDGLPSGDWAFSVNGADPKQVHIEPSSCLDVALATP